MSTNSACCASFWTKEENKAFENALAIYGDVDKWENIAAVIPGKTVEDIKHHYRALVDDVIAIDAGLVPLPKYSSSSQNSSNLAGGVSINIGGNQTGQAQSDSSNEKRSARTVVERKRGRPWTEDEHRRFLQGLEKYGKGDWRSISRHFMVSRTPTQVASHAQKYYKRLQSAPRRRRSSIHDITSVDSGSTSAAGKRSVAGERSEVAQVETMGDTSASQRPLFTGQMSGAGGIEFIGNRTSQQLPVSAQTIGLVGVDFAGGTSIPQIPLTAQPTGAAAVRPIDYADGIVFTGNRASQQLPVSAQMIGLAGGTSIRQMLTVQSTGAAAVGPVDYPYGIGFTGNRASQQLPVSAQMIGLVGVDFARGTSIPQMPGFAGADFAGGTSIPQMPLTVQPTGAAAVGPIDYTESLIRSSFLGVSGFPPTPRLPIRRPVTSTVGMPISLSYPTSTMYGVARTPYGLFIRRPPLYGAPMTYRMPPPDQNR